MDEHAYAEEVELSKVYNDLEHIRENLAKRQYLNAASWAAAMVPSILALFGMARRGS